MSVRCRPRSDEALLRDPSASSGALFAGTPSARHVERGSLRGDSRSRERRVDVKPPPLDVRHGRQAPGITSARDSGCGRAFPRRRDGDGSRHRPGEEAALRRALGRLPFADRSARAASPRLAIIHADELEVPPRRRRGQSVSPSVPTILRRGSFRAPARRPSDAAAGRYVVRARSRRAC